MDTIFIPVDFSNSSKAALRLGISLAATMKMRLIVSNVYSLPLAELTRVNTEPELETLIEQTEQKLLKKLLTFVSKEYTHAGFKSIPAHTRCTVIFNNLPAETIAAQASDHKAKLIIVGTHGVTGFRKIFLGSTAAALIQRSAVPVLSVPAGNRRKTIHNICLATDLVQIEAELKLLRPLAKSMQAHIHLLHLQYGHINESLISATRKLLSKPSNKNISFSTKPADLAKKLVNQLAAGLPKTTTDVLVMFPHKKNFWDRLLFGSKTEDMSGTLKIPLLTLKFN